MSVLTLMCISENVNNIVYRCKICHVDVNNKDSAAQCDICQSWVDIKCNKLDHIDNKYLQGSNEPWYCLSLKPPFDLALLYNQIKNTSPEKDNDLVNVVNSKYYDIDQIQTLKFPNKHKSLSLFHINACSLNKNFDDLDHLLKCTNKAFDIIAVTETRITKQSSLTTNINLTNFAIEFTLLNLQLEALSSTLLITCLINLVLILIFIKLTS